MRKGLRDGAAPCGEHSWPLFCLRRHRLSRTVAPAHLFLDRHQTLPQGDIELENWFWVEGQIPSNPYVYVSDSGLARTDRRHHLAIRDVAATRHCRDVATDRPQLHQSRCPLPVLATRAGRRVSAAPPRGIPTAASSYAYSTPYACHFEPTYSYNGYNKYASGCSYYNAPQIKVLFALTYGSLKSVRATLNVGSQFGLPFGQGDSAASFSLLGTAGLGISVPLGSEFRIAAELDGQVSLTGLPPAPYTAQLFLGPSVAWTRGQIWVTFGSLFGLTRNSNRFVPKVLWGITF